MTAARAGQRHAGPPGPGWPVLLLRVAGAGLLIATGAIHLDLYLTGYRTIPTIGWLFLLQVIAAFALALAVLVTGGRHVIAGRLAAAAGAVFALATLGGYLLSVWIGLFGFKEVRTTAGIVAGVIEVAAFAVLAALALAPARRTPSPAPAPAGARQRPRPDSSPRSPRQPPGRQRRSRRPWPLPRWCCSPSQKPGPVLPHQPPPAPALALLKTTVIGGTTVLTNAQGFTLYSFAPDTPAVSKCYGSCAAYWPPVTGTAPASPGLPGTVGTITRTGGARQLTYNGHPLYTYVGDAAPGQAKGNNLNLNGGLWHEVPVSR